MGEAKKRRVHPPEYVLACVRWVCPGRLAPGMRLMPEIIERPQPETYNPRD